MVYLIAEILCSSIITIVFKIAGLKKINSKHIILVNYIYAFLFYLINVISKYGISVLLNIKDTNYTTLFSEKNLSNSIFLCVVLGLIQGIFYVSSIVATDRSVVKNGAGLSSFFTKSSFIGSAIVMAILWKEYPTKLQLLGMAIIVIALLLTISNLGKLNVTAPKLFIANFMASTCCQLFNKAFARYGISEHKIIFMMFVFLSALIAFNLFHKSFNLQFWKEAIFNPKTLISGIALGVANSLSSLFQLKALDVLSASIVYPAFAAGNLLVVFLVGKLVFKEKSNLKQIIAMALLTIALVIVNL